jgi:hypothetical protein
MSKNGFPRHTVGHDKAMQSRSVSTRPDLISLHSTGRSIRGTYALPRPRTPDVGPTAHASPRVRNSESEFNGWDRD